MTKNLTPFIILATIFFILIVIVKTKDMHKDIVIKTNTEEFIIDGYELEDDGCVYFDFEGEDKMICEEYEIIE
jgi:hypothetical protein